MIWLSFKLQLFLTNLELFEGDKVHGSDVNVIEGVIVEIEKIKDDSGVACS